MKAKVILAIMLNHRLIGISKKSQAPNMMQFSDTRVPIHLKYYHNSFDNESFSP